ncbi:MAG: outer membrane lipid asymmetry maintenance protein MlaD [Sphingomonadales bacterium]|nr:outer membrane lipid asymmetry maintenance protein MlaD [Sphingomonadales bacterium]
MKNNLVEALIGAAVLLFAAGFFMFTYSRTDVGLVNGYELVAKFDRIDGLDIGSDVRMSGIRIGSVMSQEIDLESYLAVVRFSVDSNIQLPMDSSAEISSDGLLGGKYISLTPGGMEDYLEKGDELEFTQGSVDLYDLIGQAIYSTNDGDKKD